MTELDHWALLSAALLAVILAHMIRLRRSGRAPRPPLWKRLAWFIGLAVSASAVTAVVAYAMKALLPDYPHG